MLNKPSNRVLGIRADANCVVQRLLDAIKVHN